MNEKEEIEKPKDKWVRIIYSACWFCELVKAAEQGGLARSTKAYDD